MWCWVHFNYLSRISNILSNTNRQPMFTKSNRIKFNCLESYTDSIIWLLIRILQRSETNGIRILKWNIWFSIMYIEVEIVTRKSSVLILLVRSGLPFMTTKPIRIEYSKSIGFVSRNKTALFLPWSTKENEESTYRFIRRTIYKSKKLWFLIYKGAVRQ